MVLALAHHRLLVLLVATQLNLRTDCLVCKWEVPVVVRFNRQKRQRYSQEGLLLIGNAQRASLVVDLRPRLKT